MAAPRKKKGPVTAPAVLTHGASPNPYAAWKQVGQNVAAASGMSQQSPGFSFSPFKPPVPPTGSYDPSLDTNLAAAHRGYGDLTGDINTDPNKGPLGTQPTRLITDYLTGKAGIAQGASRGYQDLGTQETGVNTSFGRSLADLLTGRANEATDYGTQTAAVGRAYGVKANQQLEARAAGGLLGGSAGSQAAAALARHHGLDQAGLDTTHQRYADASTLAQTRLGQDKGTALDAIDTARTRLGQDTGYDANGNPLSDLPATSQLAQLNLNSAPADASNPLGGRQWQDWTTTLQRAGREDTQATIDTGTIKGAQAAAAGWNPPAGAMPKNEFVGPDGKHYQTHVIGNTIVTVDAHGNVVKRAKVKK